MYKNNCFVFLELCVCMCVYVCMCVHMVYKSTHELTHIRSFQIKTF